MTLQEMYDYVRACPGTTANVPREIRRAAVGVPYEKAARLVQLGYIRAVDLGTPWTHYMITEKSEPYSHSGSPVLVPAPISTDPEA